MLISVWNICDLCGCSCDEWEYDSKTDKLICLNCSDKQYEEDKDLRGE